MTRRPAKSAPRPCNAASSLAGWYLREAARLQRAGAFSPALAQAGELLKWLLEQSGRADDHGRLAIRAEAALRTKAALDPVLKTLDEHGWLRWQKDGKGKSRTFSVYEDTP